MPAVKRPGGDDLTDGTAIKQQRTEQDGDFLSAGKRKSLGSSRTGQACDRCKIRKIRCDARLGGCSPCMQNNTECKTTDRITGRATSRGHTENLEHENAVLKAHLAELSQQLKDSGIEPKATPIVLQEHNAATPLSPLLWNQAQSTTWDDGHLTNNNSPAQGRPDRHNTNGALLPDFRPGCIGDNYLGVSSENNWLSPIEGTSLRIFGTKIDLNEFMPPEADPTISAMSYRTFLNHAFGKIRAIAPPLPDYQQCRVYANWYFRSIQVFVPILHRPDFMQLLDRVHHRNYECTPAENVSIHMVLSIINFQFSVRNRNEQAQRDAMKHYHYALSFIPELITGHTLQDIQALTLICSQLRNQPRPAAAWMFTNSVMGIAIESGLHRSAKAWQNSGIDQDTHHLEMRKRIFWSLLLIHVHISGKLGRPMPLRLEDLDIELPEAAKDTPPENSDWGQWKQQCSFRAGIEGFKLLKIMHQVYALIYSIKSTGQYEKDVKQLDLEIDAFQAQLPPQLRTGPPHLADVDRIPALYLDMSVAECQLLLHHPSLCRSQAASLMSTNLDICLHWSGRLLSAASDLKSLKSLDTTWFYTTDFLAAIFTTLFAHTERADHLTSEQAQVLREDMDRWLDILGEVGSLLGTGPRLQTALRHIIDSSLTRINNHLAAKTASAAVASASSPLTEGAQARLCENTPAYNIAAYSNGSGHGAMSTHSSYSPGNGFAYPDAPSTAIPTYTTDTLTGFDHSAYSPVADSKPILDAQLPASNFMTAMPSNFQQGPSEYAPARATAWRHFADTVSTNLTGQEYLPSAGAFVAPNGTDKGQTGTNLAMVASMGNMILEPGMVHARAPPWPLMLYQNHVDDTGQ